jgi:hypothetical protein
MARTIQPTVIGLVWTGYLVVALLLLGVVPGPAYPLAVGGLGLVLAVATLPFAGTRWLSWTPAWVDIAALGALYLAVVGLFRLAFGVFTTANTLGLFLTFAAALLLGVVGPLLHIVVIRRRGLAALGLTREHLGQTVALAILLAAVQAAITLPTIAFGAPDSWLPLLAMSLVVGFFEAIFFRAYVLAILEPAFGLAPAVAVSAGLYAVYHVGYGMGADEMLFLAGLGLVYAAAFALARNVVVLWPLLTPLGGFFATVRAGDISMPLESILGFGWVLVGMLAAVYGARRLSHRRERGAASPRRLTRIGAHPMP